MYDQGYSLSPGARLKRYETGEQISHVVYSDAWDGGGGEEGGFRSSGPKV